MDKAFQAWLTKFNNFTSHKLTLDEQNIAYEAWQASATHLLNTTHITRIHITDKKGTPLYIPKLPKNKLESYIKNKTINEVMDKRSLIGNTIRKHIREETLDDAISELEKLKDEAERKMNKAERKMNKAERKMKKTKGVKGYLEWTVNGIKVTSLYQVITALEELKEKTGKTTK